MSASNQFTSEHLLSEEHFAALLSSRTELNAGFSNGYGARVNNGGQLSYDETPQPEDSATFADNELNSEPTSDHVLVDRNYQPDTRGENLFHSEADWRREDHLSNLHRNSFVSQPIQGHHSGPVPQVECENLEFAPQVLLDYHQLQLAYDERGAEIEQLYFREEQHIAHIEQLRRRNAELESAALGRPPYPAYFDNNAMPISPGYSQSKLPEAQDLDHARQDGCLSQQPLAEAGDLPVKTTGLKAGTATNLDNLRLREIGQTKAEYETLRPWDRNKQSFDRASKNFGVGEAAKRIYLHEYLRLLEIRVRSSRRNKRRVALKTAWTEIHIAASKEDLENQRRKYEKQGDAAGLKIIEESEARVAKFLSERDANSRSG